MRGVKERLCYVTAVAFMFVLLSSTLVLAASAHYTTAQKPGSWVKSGDNYY